MLNISACSLFSDNQAEHGFITSFNLTKDVNKQVLTRYLSSANKQLLSMSTNNSHACLNGQVMISEKLLMRAQAEFESNMLNDAFLSLVEFDRQMRKLRCIYQYLDGQFGCAQSNKTKVLKQWYLDGEFQQCQIDKTELAITKEGNLNQSNQKALSVSQTILTETLYDFDQENIKAIYYPALNNLVNLMRTYPLSTLKVTGHTDSKGTSSYNQILANKRATNVASYFIDRGIDKEKITISSMGETLLRELETQADLRVFNRHTQILLTLDTRVTNHEEGIAHD